MPYFSAGDTKFSVFTDPLTPPSLLSVELLITEDTYLDRHEVNISKAQQWEHTHLAEFGEQEHLFQGVGHLLLIHNSDRYSPREVQELCEKILPPCLQSKTHCSTLAKRMG